MSSAVPLQPIASWDTAVRSPVVEAEFGYIIDATTSSLSPINTMTTKPTNEDKGEDAGPPIDTRGDESWNVNTDVLDLAGTLGVVPWEEEKEPPTAPVEATGPTNEWVDPNPPNQMQKRMDSARMQYLYAKSDLSDLKNKLLAAVTLKRGLKFNKPKPKQTAPLSVSRRVKNTLRAVSLGQFDDHIDYHSEGMSGRIL